MNFQEHTKSNSVQKADTIREDLPQPVGAYTFQTLMQKARRTGSVRFKLYERKSEIKI